MARAAATEVLIDPEAPAQDGPEPVVLVPCHATWVTPTLQVVGWCCWDAPLPTAEDCTMSHCVRAGAVTVCQRCRREYGVFTNRSSLDGALVLTRRV